MTNKVNEQKVNKKTVRLRTYLLLATFAVIAVIVTMSNLGGTLAWYSNAKTQAMDLSSAKIYYTLSATNPTDLIMQPNKNLFDSITLTNFSTSESNIRFKIQYDYYTNTGTTEAPVYTKSTGYVKVAPSANAVGATADQYFDISLDTTADTGFSYVPYTDDGWWEKGENIPAVAEANVTTGEVVNIFASGNLKFAYNGLLTANEFAGKPVTVTVTFQAKQAEGVTWSNIGTVTAYIPPVSGG